jgi:DnaK suppressor protein
MSPRTPRTSRSASRRTGPRPAVAQAAPPEARAALALRLQDARVALDRAERTLAQVRRLQSGADDDEHDPDGVPLSFEWSKAMAVRDQARARVASLEDAAARADAGTFGVCSRCGRLIDPRRLAARPDATLCIDCARRG